MSFKILSQGLVSEFAPQPTLNLVGNIEDKITATIDVVFEGGIYYATPSLPIIYGSPNTNDANYQKYISVNAPVFGAFRVGDSISILDPAQPNDGITATITEIINDTKFIIDTALTVGNSTTGVVLNETPMQGLKFSFGLPNNTDAPSVISRIDGNPQEFRFEGYPTGSTAVETMTPAGSKSWQRGSVTVQRLSTGTGNGQQQFRFVHTFYISPTYLAGQLNNFGSGLEPAYFGGGGSIRYDFSIQGGRDLSNDSLLRSTEFNRILGNVGWFNENFNGGVNDYNLVSTTYRKLPSLEVINGIELTTDEQEIELVVLAAPTTSFVNNNSQFRISHHFLPANEGEYQNNGKTVEENFYIDRCFQTVGSAAIAGDNFGTDQQVFKEVSAVWDNANQITITAKVQLTQPMVDDLSERTQKRFVIGVAVSDYTLPTPLQNRVNLYNTSLYAVNTLDAGIFGLNTVVLNHYETDVATEGTTTPTGRIEDDLLAYTKFELDRNGRENDDIDIKNATIEIIAEKTDGSFFVLESFTKSFSGLDVINGEKYLDFVQPKAFKMPDGEQRKLIQVRRNPNLDTGLLKVYEFYYPFRMRNETWIANSNVSDDFFNTSLPNNGKNELWNRFEADANYSLKYWFRISSTKNGNPQEQSLKNEITSFTYAEGADWDNETIVALDANGVELVNGADKYLTLFDDMTIRSEFEWVGSGLPTTTDIVAVFMIDLYEQGTIYDTRYLSSVYNWEQYSYFESLNQSGTVEITNPSGLIFRAEAKLRTSELPTATEYKISVRYYNKASETFYILQEDDFKILQEDDSSGIEVEH